LNRLFQNSFPSIKCHCTTTKEIENIIRSLKSSNSCGYDEVPSKLLKSCSYFISALLNFICNGALFTGVFPARLKYATIRPLFKKGNKNDMSNYRPISILTSFSKLFEKVLQTRLLKHLTGHNILVKQWYVFRTKLKTGNATYQLTDEILNALNNDLLIGGIFVILKRHLIVLITKFY
jgi:Notch-like protein